MPMDVHPASSDTPNGSRDAKLDELFASVDPETRQMIQEAVMIVLWLRDGKDGG